MCNFKTNNQKLWFWKIYTVYTLQIYRYNLKCKEEERKVLAIFIAEIFLNEIESSDKYKRFVEQGNNGKKQNEEEFVFIDNKNFGNIVGVLHEKDWSGRKLKNLFNSTIKDDSNNDYALNKDDESSDED